MREDNTRAEFLVQQLPGTMYRIWPDYWGGMPHGQLGEAATLHEMGINLANGTWPDWYYAPISHANSHGFHSVKSPADFIQTS